VIVLRNSLPRLCGGSSGTIPGTEYCGRGFWRPVRPNEDRLQTRDGAVLVFLAEGIPYDQFSDLLSVFHVLGIQCVGRTFQRGGDNESVEDVVSEALRNL
jgi:hypothetical protein